MATKTINLPESSYKRLAALKKENESFGDVVDRLTGKHRLFELVGILSKKEAEVMRKAIKESRERMDADFEKTAKKMAGK